MMVYAGLFLILNSTPASWSASRSSSSPTGASRSPRRTSSGDVRRRVRGVPPAVNRFLPLLRGPRRDDAGHGLRLAPRGAEGVRRHVRVDHHALALLVWEQVARHGDRGECRRTRPGGRCRLDARDRGLREPRATSRRPAACDLGRDAAQLVAEGGSPEARPRQLRACALHPCGRLKQPRALSSPLAHSQMRRGVNKCVLTSVCGRYWSHDT